MRKVRDVLLFLAAVVGSLITLYHLPEILERLLEEEFAKIILLMSVCLLGVACVLWFTP